MSEIGTFIDNRDGYSYRTVTIDGREWLAENLRYAAEGSKIYGDGGMDSIAPPPVQPSLAEIQAECEENKDRWGIEAKAIGRSKSRIEARVRLRMIYETEAELGKSIPLFSYNKYRELVPNEENTALIEGKVSEILSTSASQAEIEAQTADARSNAMKNFVRNRYKEKMNEYNMQVAFYEKTKKAYQSDTDVYLNKNNAQVDAYGRLYDLNTALKACPDGWRLPTSDEWLALGEYAGKQVAIYDDDIALPGLAKCGVALKSATLWASLRNSEYNSQMETLRDSDTQSRRRRAYLLTLAEKGIGTDELGFCAKPGGQGILWNEGDVLSEGLDSVFVPFPNDQSKGILYMGKTYEGFWWSSTTETISRKRDFTKEEMTDTMARIFGLRYDITGTPCGVRGEKRLNLSEPSNFLSVRCVRA